MVDRHDGHFPKSIALMRQLPGIGKYTAHAIATFAFDQPVPILEANTARVLARLFNFRSPIDRTAGREALWTRAAMLVPKRSTRIYNSALTDLGALVCLPRRPQCGICPVEKFCRAKTPETLPTKNVRPRIEGLTENHAFIVQPNKILLQQANHRWHGMWILPPLQRRSANRRAVYKSIFPFTNHRVALNVYAGRLRKIDRASERWIKIDSLAAVPIPSPHRRAIVDLLTTARAGQFNGKILSCRPMMRM